MIRPSKVMAAAVVAVTSLAAAANAPVLEGVSGGIWEVSGNKAPAARICAADPLQLASYEHRAVPCTRTLVRGSAASAVVTYSCSNGGFGQSTISLITPRSLHIETQGISGGAPYQYTLEARRVGDCAHH
jgi:hypothetical protein